MSDELKILDSLSAPLGQILQAAHDLDTRISARMSFLAAQEAKPTPPPISVPSLTPNETSGIVEDINSRPNLAPVPAAPQIVAPNRLINLPFSKILDDDFLNSVLWVEDTIGLNAHNLLCCMGFETGRTFSPHVRNSGSSATGLIQFMRPTALRLGTTVEDLVNMDRVHQMNYVFRYFQEYKQRGFDLSKWNLGDCYMSILWPAGIGKDDSFACFVNGKGAAYAANRGLDADKNGIVTRGECLIKIRQVEAEGMAQRRAV